LKDPYVFDFLTLAPDAQERDLERGLVEHVREFLLELGAGCATRSVARYDICTPSRRGSTVVRSAIKVGPLEFSGCARARSPAPAK
jgi:predicted nuclease of restriction endonuclease-like (RecB) superfamily